MRLSLDVWQVREPFSITPSSKHERWMGSLSHHSASLKCPRFLTFSNRREITRNGESSFPFCRLFIVIREEKIDLVASNLTTTYQETESKGENRKKSVDSERETAKMGKRVWKKRENDAIASYDNLPHAPNHRISCLSAVSAYHSLPRLLVPSLPLLSLDNSLSGSINLSLPPLAHSSTTSFGTHPSPEIFRRKS